ncbi:hypothetical protein AOQ84DRAFT_65973 [Glonium stellatum]|uniref:Uncharacterized protein n=1 Tax=Glonium stellatum TaxID=574774 RepID=A0A8E2JRP9_9PEZI|nr:hypothetical protein AOQ84DRAFT_65973 [Glonium stellatum]
MHTPSSSPHAPTHYLTQSLSLSLPHSLTYSLAPHTQLPEKASVSAALSCFGQRTQHPAQPHDRPAPAAFSPICNCVSRGISDARNPSLAEA